MFEDKILLITGGTGSFGGAVLKRFLDHQIKEIRVFSRDEKKQDDLRKEFNNEKLRFYVGDVRDIKAVKGAMRGVDYVFHAAALKQVPSCEFHPMEAFQTNVIGTENVIDAAIESGVSKLICLSTDKAVYPVNAMGMSKAMMEKVMVAKSRNLAQEDIVVCGTRYGNVMSSRGSVIPLFIDQFRRGIPLTITDPNMTRFMMTLDDAVDLVLYAFLNGDNGDIFVQKAPAASIEILSKAILELLGNPNHPRKIIGTRHGEKLYESLLSREERVYAQDLDDYFRITPDHRNLNYGKYIESGNEAISQSDEYNSHNTKRLDLEGMRELLCRLEFFQELSLSQLNT